MQAYYQHGDRTICNWIWRQRVQTFRVPAVYLTWANSLFLAFLAFSRINNLRRVNQAPNSDSPRRHQTFFLSLSCLLVRDYPSLDMSVRTEPPALPRDISVHVFVNRAAGRHRAASYLPRLQTLFESRGFVVQFVKTSGADELESAARSTIDKGHRVLLALGGDGTFQALVNGVYGSDAMIGIVPAGGGNDFAAALGLPSDPVAAAQIILKSKPRFVDMVRVRTADGRTRLYAGGGGIGLDAEAALLANGPYRHLPGRLRYIASALRALSKHLPLKLRLEFPCEDFFPVESGSLLAGVLNTPTYGAGLRLAPDARIDDGLLDVVLLEDLSALSVLRLLPRLMGSGELRTPRVRRWKVKSVKMCADRPSLFHGDGEILGHAPVEIEVVPGAVQVLAP